MYSIKATEYFFLTIAFPLIIYSSKVFMLLNELDITLLCSIKQRCLPNVLTK